MIAKGLVERERSTVDARANAVRLTEAGRAALETARPQVEGADKRILALLPGGKRQGFLEVLRAFAHAGEAEDRKKKPKADKKAGKRAKGEKPAKAAKPDKKKKKVKKAA